MRHHHRIGLALGSGAARGWAHIGVLRTLAEAGIAPDIVAGASIGAAVGAAYCAGRLDAYEAFARRLDRRQVWGYFDLSFRGGLIKGRKVFDFAWADLPDLAIEDLERSFAAVAVDVALGREVWLRQGRLLDCLRASAAIPGIVTPVNIDGRWLIDGGVLNPVPVNVCRALGATLVIAVDLNTQLAPRRFADQFRDRIPPAPEMPTPPETTAVDPAGERSWQAAMREMAAELQQWVRGDPNKPKEQRPPTMFEVMGATVDIMSTCISRSRIGGDPPDMMIAPRLPDFTMFDFHRAAEAIAEGRRATLHALASAPAEFGPLCIDEIPILPPEDLGPAAPPLTRESPSGHDDEHGAGK